MSAVKLHEKSNDPALIKLRGNREPETEWLQSKKGGLLRTMIKILIVASVLGGLLAAKPFLLCAQENEQPTEAIEDDWGDSNDEGFGAESGKDFFDLKVDLSEIEKVETSPVQFYGFFKEELAYSHAVDDPFMSKVRSVLNLGLDLNITEQWKGKFVWNGFYDDAYRQKGRDEFTDDTLEDYESESELRDFYLEGPIVEGIRLKTGRQIIAWGESETAQIIDMANPRDQRELGQVDIEDARIPVAATKLAFIGKGIELDLVALHEFRANKTGGEGADFDPLINLRSGAVIQDAKEPSSAGENTEYLIRMFGQIPGSDFSIVWGDVFEDSPYLNVVDLETLPSPYPVLQPEYRRIKVVGFSVNRAIGSTLIKLETAKHYHSAVMRGDLETQIQEKLSTNPALELRSWEEKDLAKGMLGMEYTGVTDLNISLEVSATKIEDYQEELASEEISGMTSLMLTYDTFNQTLKYQAMLVGFFNGNGEVYRVMVSYDLMDALEISAGAIWYAADQEDDFVYPYRNQDRYLASMKFSF